MPDAHLKRQIMGREVVVAKGKLDFGKDLLWRICGKRSKKIQLKLLAVKIHANHLRELRALNGRIIVAHVLNFPWSQISNS